MGMSDSAAFAAYRAHDALIKRAKLGAAVKYRTDTLASTLQGVTPFSTGLLALARAAESRAALEVDELLKYQAVAYEALSACCRGHSTFVDAASGLATIYVHTDRVDEALVLVEEAVAAARDLQDMREQSLSVALYNLALTQSVAGQHEASADHYAEAHRQFTRLYPPDHPSVVQSASNAGGAYLTIDRTDEALVYLTRALERIDGLPLNLQANVLMNWGNLMQAVGEPRQAAYWNLRAQGALEQLVDDEHPLLFEHIGNTVNHLFSDGRLAQADTLLARLRTALPKQPVGYSRTLGRMQVAGLEAERALLVEDAAVANRYADQAYQLASELFGEQQTPLLEQLNLQARARLARGDYRDALRLLDREEAGYVALGDEDANGYFYRALERSAAQRGLGDTTQALATLRTVAQAVAARQLLGREGVITLDLAVAFADLDIAASGSVRPADWLLVGRLVTQTLEQASLPAALFGSQAAGRTQLEYAFAKTARHSAERCGNGGGEEHCLAALRFTDLARGIVLQNRARRAVARSSFGLPDSVQRRTQVLEAALLVWQNQPANQTRRQYALDSLGAAYAAHEAELLARYPRYLTTLAHPVLDPQDAVAFAREHALTFLTLTVDSASQTLTRCEVSSAGVVADVRPFGAQEWAALKRLRRALSTPGPAEFAADAELLYRVLLAGDADVELSPKLVVSTDAHLAGMPLGALLREPPRPGTPMRMWDFAMKSSEISYADALHSYLLTAQAKGRAATTRTPTLAAVAPGFEGNVATDRFAVAQGPRPRLTRTPWTSMLLDWLATQVGGTTLEGNEATESSTLSLARESDILHLGTHAFLDEQTPLRSYFALASVSAASEEDGRLHAYELYPQRLHARLAVLPACHSGVGAYAAGYGALSLATAIRAAGCPTVVQSVWAIDDEQTNVQLRQFYESILSHGSSTAMALSEVQREYLRTVPPPLQHPYYWAGLVTVGPSATLQPAAQHTGVWLVVALVAVVLIVGLYLSARRRIA